MSSGAFFGGRAGGFVGVPMGGFVTGCIAGSATAALMPSHKCSAAKFKAYSTNTGNVYIGPDTSVTIAGSANNFTGGWELAAGEETEWLSCSNLDEFARICDNATDDLSVTLLP